VVNLDTHVRANGDTRTVHRTCPLCEATCGLELRLEGSDIALVRGDRDDVFSHGFLCPKGTALKQLESDPDRLRRPLVRQGDTWRAVSWDDAFAEVERGLTPILDRHGRDAVAMYIGNPNVHNLAGTLYGACSSRRSAPEHVLGRRVGRCPSRSRPGSCSAWR
jgi:anaerobic selenocysteine-containing dehydrogenase